MTLSKWKIVTAIAILSSGLVAGAGALAFQEEGKKAGKPPSPPGPNTTVSPKEGASPPAISAAERNALVTELQESVELLEVQLDAKNAELEAEKARTEFQKRVLDERSKLRGRNSAGLMAFLEAELGARLQESRVKVKEAELREATLRLAHAKRKAAMLLEGTAAPRQLVESTVQADMQGRLRALEQKVDRILLELDALKPQAK